MQPSTLNIFVDEAGTPVISGESAKEYYVICGLLINSLGVERCRERIGNIISKHAGNGELKSTKVGTNFERRKKILSEFFEEKIPFYALAVNKEEVWPTSGLKWPKSSYKYLHSMFYHRIKRTHHDIEIISDLYGKSEFMAEFKVYIEDKNSCFEKFTFSSAKLDPLLQLADFISGSIRRFLMNEDPIATMECIGYPSVPIETWPPHQLFHTMVDDDSHKYPQNVIDQIAKHSVNSARELIEQNIDSDDKFKRTQAEIFRFLLYKFSNSPNTYVKRSEIVAHIFKTFGFKIRNTTLTRKYISSARDKGVIVACTDSGLKIPYTPRDFEEWISRINTQVTPYLKRLEIARQDVLISTENTFDIVDKDKFPDLSRFTALHTNIIPPQSESKAN